MGRMMRLAAAAMLVVFISWAAFQYNDPDSAAWIVIYSLSALTCALFLVGKLPLALPAVLAGVCLVWALLLVPPALGHDISLFLDEVEGELWREMAGLLIVGAWNGFLAWKVYRRQTRRASPLHAS